MELHLGTFIYYITMYMYVVQLGAGKNQNFFCKGVKIWSLPNRWALAEGDRTKWYGKNGSNFYRFYFYWIEYIFSNHKLQI